MVIKNLFINKVDNAINANIKGLLVDISLITLTMFFFKFLFNRIVIKISIRIGNIMINDEILKEMQLIPEINNKLKVCGDL